MRSNVKVCGAASTSHNEAMPSPPRPAPPPCYVSLELVPRDVECSVEDTQDIYVAIVLDEVCDAVLPIQQYAHVTRGCGVP